MRRSVNEIQLAVLKAARGSGLAEGLCEDLAHGAAWLCRAGLDGAGAALAALRAPDAARRPVCIRRGGQHVFELASAASSAPSALDLLIAGRAPAVRLERIDVPLMVLGHAGAVGRAHGRALRLSDADDRSVLVAGQRVTGCGAEGLSQAWIVVEEAPQPPPGQGARRATSAAAGDGADADDNIFAALAALGARTYVPASRRSRETGAGAGRIDDD